MTTHHAPFRVARMGFLLAAPVLFLGIPGETAWGRQVGGQAAAPVASPRRSPVAGMVRDQAGLPMSGVTVTLDGGIVAATSTAADGRFRFEGVPGGTVTITARRLGFRPETRSVQVPLVGDGELEFRLLPLAPMLAPVTVFQQREVYDARLAGFQARAAARKGGYFITRERIQRSTGWSLPDVIREVPGVRIAPVNGIRKAVRLRGATCAPLVFVDGFAASAGEFDLEMLPLGSLEGVEVYSSMATLPAEFGAARGSERCGVIAVWSRPASRPRERVSDVAPVDLERLVAESTVFTADQVHRGAQLDTAASPEVVYPDSLWKAGQGGRAVIELVSAPDGSVEPGTARVVTASHPAFGRAALEALAASFFSPALIGRRAVRQLVQVPVVFAPGTAPSPGSGPPPT